VLSTPSKSCREKGSSLRIEKEFLPQVEITTSRKKEREKREILRTVHHEKKIILISNGGGGGGGYLYPIGLAKGGGRMGGNGAKERRDATLLSAV